MITEMKDTLDEINIKLDGENKISDLEDKVEGNTQSEHTHMQRILKNEDSLNVLWDNNKHNNIHIIGYQKKEKMRN